MKNAFCDTCLPPLALAAVRSVNKLKKMQKSKELNYICLTVGGWEQVKCLELLHNSCQTVSD